MTALGCKSARVAATLRQQLPLVGIAAQPKRDSSNLAAYKRGRGGRSSFSGDVVTVFGSSGTLAVSVVNRLGKMGAQVILPYRCDPYYLRPLKLAGDLGQILFNPFDPRDEDSIRKVVKHSNCVINLIGRDRPTTNYTLKECHVDIAEKIARISADCGVRTLIHMSANGATPDPEPKFLRKGSEFLRTKYEGEQRVRDAFPDAVIMRPADVYGFDDRFLHYYADGRRRLMGTVPLHNRGEDTYKMPVFSGDVTTAIMNAMHDRSAIGNTYEAVGPRVYTNAELVDFIYRCCRWPGIIRTGLHPLTRPWLAFAGRFGPWMAPLVSAERVERDSVSNILKPGDLTLEDLGVEKLELLENHAEYHLRPFRTKAYINETMEDRYKPPLPQYLTKEELSYA